MRAMYRLCPRPDTGVLENQRDTTGPWSSTLLTEQEHTDNRVIVIKQFHTHIMHAKPESCPPGRLDPSMFEWLKLRNVRQSMLNRVVRIH